MPNAPKVTAFGATGSVVGATRPHFVEASVARNRRHGNPWTLQNPAGRQKGRSLWSWMVIRVPAAVISSPP